MAARPIFIVSSGRSGTKMMERLFSAYPQVEMHHEYMVHQVQQAAVRYQLGIASVSETRHVLSQTHGAAVFYCDRKIWGDTSNKLTWVIDILSDLFPDARFVHLARDGRKVASSYLHKLADECYDDASTRILADYVDRYPTMPAPPPEKRYWWPQPRRGSLQRMTFRTYSQFDRIAYHWAESHRTALTKLETVTADRQLFIRLEDLVANPAELARLIAFLGLEERPDLFALLAKPHNVNRPTDTPLTAEQSNRFFAIAGGMMETLGYSTTPEYAVNY